MTQTDKRRKVGITAVLVLLCAVLSGCGQKKEEAASENQVTLLLANNLPEDNVTTRAVEWFIEQVEERTQGRIKIELHNDGEMGDSRSSLELVQYGGADIAKSDLSALSNFVEEFGVLSMPYIYNSTEHFWKVHDGVVGQELLTGTQLTDLGMYGLTYYDGGTRCFYNSVGEIHSPSDMAGMTVRVQQSEIMMSMVRALGARPLHSDYSDVYHLLQTGEVAAAENSIVNYYNASFYEVAPYFVEDAHTRSADILVMSTKSREKLGAEDLAILDQTAADSCEYQKQLWIQAEEDAKQQLLEKNVVITEPTPEEYERFRSACEQIWYSYRDGKYINLIDRIVAADYE